MAATCTVVTGPAMERCGAPAARTFTGREGEPFAECRHHAGLPSAPPPPPPAAVTLNYRQMGDLWLFANRGEQAVAASQVRRLEGAGLIQRTGRRVGNSTLFAITPAGRATAEHITLDGGRFRWVDHG